jgi:tetratricopeptide (TPR) repeat protein
VRTKQIIEPSRKRLGLSAGPRAIDSSRGRCYYRASRACSNGLVMKRNLPTVLFSFVVFAVSLAVYLITLPRSILPGDSGELIAASYTLSIGHPPGFPLYLMLGKLFSSLFAFGSIAYRYNLYSAVVASATAGVLFSTLVSVGVGRLLGVAVALGLATLGSYWIQATTGDVYTLNGLFTALLLYVAVVGKRYGERALLLVGFIGGLAISHHLTVVYGLASALVILFSGLGTRPRAKTLILSIFLFCLGLSVWIYIPIRSHLKPDLTWGDTDTLPGFMAHITAQTYRWRLRTFEFGHRALDLLRYFKVLARASGGPLMFLACLAVVFNLRRLRLIGGFVLLAVLYAFHYVVYNIPDIESHIFPALLGIAVLAGMGLQRIYDLRRMPRIAHIAAVALASLMVVLNLLHIHPRRDEWFALDYAHAIEASAAEACGKDGIIICTGDVSYPLLYDSFTDTGSARAFYVGLTDPRLVGLEEGPTTLDGWVAAAVRKLGISRVALFGAAPPYVMGRPTRVCGLVQVIGEDSTQYRSPLDFPVRGVGQDLRDYASRLLSGDYYSRLARWCVERKDAAGARDYIAKALTVAYDDVSAHIDAARLYRDMGMTSDARRVLVLALKIDPDFFETHDMLAGLALQGGDADGAIVEYKKALKGNPSPGPLYSNLGAAYLTKADYPSALESFNRAIASDSTLVNAYVGIGRAYEAQGRVEEALSYYDRARRRDPSGDLAIHAQASLLLKVGKYGEARGVIQEALSGRPGGALLFSDLGLAFLRGGALDSAITYFKEALAADPSMLVARGNLAVAYEGKGLKREAIEQYQIYLKSAPAGKARDMASKALNELVSPQ